jgi:hypothetical protein
MRAIAVRSDTGGITLRVFDDRHGEVLAIELAPRAALLLGADLVALAAGAELTLEPREPVLRGKDRYGEGPLGP